MAIRFIREWHTIIINVEKANNKIEGGLIALLSDYYPPKNKTMLEKIKSMFSSAKPLTLVDFGDTGGIVRNSAEKSLPNC